MRRAGDPVTVEVIGKAVAAIRTYEYGASRKPLDEIERLVRETHGDAGARAALEDALAALLESDATRAGKQFASQVLWIIGTDRSIPVLAKMLASPETASMACYALATHPHAKASAVLRAALASARGSALIEILNLIGDRRDADAVDALAEIASGADPGAADAAIAALGKIGTISAARALGPLRASGDPKRHAGAAHALLACACGLAARGEAAAAADLFRDLAAAPDAPAVVRRGARLGLESLGSPIDFAKIPPVRLFDGKTLAGWEGNPALFRVQDGSIVAGTLKERIPRNEFLCTTREYGDFELKLQAKLIGKGDNAGIQIRSRRVPNDSEVSGYQADMGTGWWGCLYDESRRNRVLARPSEADVARILKPKDWNEYVIRCEGRRIQLFLNGVRTVDYIEPDPAVPGSGIIGLQIHGGAPSEAWYKEIEIRELTARR